MSVPAFLAAAEPLTAPLDAFFDKVFVMCEDEVSVALLVWHGGRCHCAVLWEASGPKGSTADVPTAACPRRLLLCLPSCLSLTTSTDPFYLLPLHLPRVRLQAVRQNRLALLRDLAALPVGILDLTELPGF